MSVTRNKLFKWCILMKGTPYERSRAKNSRLATIVDKWRADFIEFSSEELKEMQEVIDLILDERFYTRGR
jgi:hypothetical protein